MVRLLEPGRSGYELGGKLDLSSQRPESGDAPVRVAEVLPDGSEDVDMRLLSEIFD
jgi:hypothetical protein